MHHNFLSNPLASLPNLIKPAPAHAENHKSNHSIQHKSNHFSHTRPIFATGFCSDPASSSCYRVFMSGQGRGDRTVKVTIINTKYVETDALSFKDVVQKLTGKDSRVAYEKPEPPPAAVKTNKSCTSQFSNLRDQEIRSSKKNIYSTPTGVIPRSNSSVMMRNISFKEFDRLFREMPPMEEFWTEFN